MEKELEKTIADVSVLLAQYGKSAKKQKNAPNNVAAEKATAQKMKSQRTRKFSCTTYIDRKGLKKFLKQSPFIQHWAYCSHDKDICTDDNGSYLCNENGEPIYKEFHTHVLLYTYEAKTSSAVSKIFERYSREYYANSGVLAQNTLVQTCTDMVSMWRYLIHLDDPDKAQYPPCDRSCDNLSYWQGLEGTNGLTDSASNKSLQILSDIIEGSSVYELTVKYGGAYVLNAQKYDYVLRKFKSQQAVSNLSIRDWFALSLNGSIYSEKDIQLFFSILDFLQSEVLLNTGVDVRNYPLELYLNIAEKAKKGELKCLD